MHTTMIAKIMAKMRSTYWFEELSASLTSFLAVPQPQWALQLAGRRHGKALYASCALAQSAQPFAMLVATDVSKRSYGLVP